jgi:hypothetical protein
MQRRTFEVPRGGGFGIGSGAPVPPDLAAILAVLFLTYVLHFFRTTAALPELLQLTAAVYGGYLWQVVTYPFVGFPSGGIWFLLELLVLFWFGRDVFWRLGRRRFWTVILAGGAVAAAVAIGVQLLVAVLGGVGLTSVPVFALMQGQRMLMAILIAVFATLWGEATILLFFVVPMRARWFLWLEILFAFMAFLTVKDLAGLLGITAAVALTWASLAPGGPRQAWRRARLKVEGWLIQARLKRLRRGRRFDVVDGGNGRDRWVH